jgi:phosphatidylcholine synthase
MQTTPQARGQPVLGKRLRTFFGWCVHFYTALGLVCAAAIAADIVKGTPASFRRAFVLMMIATVIDATDGTLARAVRIKEAVPSFDGRRLDDIIDFLTYTALPLLLIWRARLLPAEQEFWLLLPLLASAYGFCQVSAKTDDGFFLGFPSYWNLIAFYLYVLDFYVVPLPSELVIGIVAGFALLTFVPARYLYPSQKGRLNMVTNVFAGAWAVLLAWVLYRLPSKPPADETTCWLVIGSLAFPLYYLAVSWGVSVQIWHRRRQERRLRRRGGSLTA